MEDCLPSPLRFMLHIRLQDHELFCLTRLSSQHFQSQRIWTHGVTTSFSFLYVNLAVETTAEKIIMEPISTQYISGQLPSTCNQSKP